MAQKNKAGLPSCTRDAILTAALALFSRKGFEGASMRDIAGEVGITQGAIYKHFKSKDDVLDAICTRMEQSDHEHAENADVPTGNPEPTDDVMPEAFRAFTLDMFAYWACDGTAAPFRRMLEIDRFRTPHMQALHTQYLGAGPLEYTTECLACAGANEQDAPQRALALWGAFRLLLELVDARSLTYEAAAEELGRVVDGALGNLPQPT